MITARQIQEKLAEEKDPLLYLDGELSRCANLMGDRCDNIRDTISSYNHRASEDELIDLQKIKGELKNLGELYLEINTYLKARKAQVKNQKRAAQLNKALAKRQQWMEQNKSAPKE